jgi:phosphatidyl-myo-inositol dimannoside synthase
VVGARARAHKAVLLAPSCGLGGGIERYIEEVVHAVGDCGWSVVQVDLHGRRKRLPRLLFVACAAWACIWHRPTVALIMHCDLFPLARLLRALGCTRLVGWIYGGEVFTQSGRDIVRRRSPLLTDLATISQFTAGKLSEAVGADRSNLVRVIEPALSDAWWEKCDQLHVEKHPRPLITMVSRLGPEIESKGIFLTIAVAAELRETYPDLELHIIGWGERAQECRERVRSMGADGWCQFLGACSDADLVRELKKSWMFVLPSRVDVDIGHGEGFGIVFVEAASAGVPVVGSSDGGAKEAVCDGITGYAVDPRDSVAIRRRCQALLEDAVLRQQMGDAGKEWARRQFSHQRITAEVSALLSGGRVSQSSGSAFAISDE